MKKRCSRCRRSLALSNFNCWPRAKVVYVQSKCKPCLLQYKREWNFKHRKKLNKQKRAYFRTQHGKEVHSRNSATYKKRYRGKCWARWTLNNAIRDGRIKRLPCEVCGNPKSEGHHKNYTEPFVVRWLCQVHHRIEEKRLFFDLARNRSAQGPGVFGVQDPSEERPWS